MKSLCGSCTFCCTALGVEKLKKPPWQKCEHASRGCGIYAQRPNSCQIFECVYVQDQQRDKVMPRSMRPD